MTDLKEQVEACLSKQLVEVLDHWMLDNPSRLKHFISFQDSNIDWESATEAIRKEFIEGNCIVLLTIPM